MSNQKPLTFHAINRAEWFDDSDHREINELAQAELDAIDWYRRISASSARAAAERYLELQCSHGDGQIERMDVYVRSEAGNITRHTVVSEISLVTREVSSKAIPGNLENKNQFSQTRAGAGILK